MAVDGQDPTANGAGRAQGRPLGPGLIETGPDPYAGAVSLGQLIAASPDAPVHILFVHGIRTGDRGSSATFRAHLSRGLADLIAGGAPLRATVRLEVGPQPDLTFMGQAIWPNAAAWAMGAFVDRYVYPRSDGAGAVVVDEVNWWPLALPLRCQALLVPEADLAGADIDNLRLCAALDPDGLPLDDGVHYPFLSPQRFADLTHGGPPGGGAARINGDLKRALLDWGLADAAIALGPMQPYLSAAMDAAFAHAAERDRRQGRPGQFVVVSESLGSFLVFDAYAHARTAVREVMDETALVYFFANQLALLELARLSSAAGTAGRLSLHQSLDRWSSRGQPAAGAAALKQILAFSDPSDALTFRVPAIDGVKVVNIYDRNEGEILGEFANPATAHSGHSANRHVLDLMLQR